MSLFARLRAWWTDPLPMNRLDAYRILTGNDGRTPRVSSRVLSTKRRLQLVQSRRMERRLEKARTRA